MQFPLQINSNLREEKRAQTEEKEDLGKVSYWKQSEICGKGGVRNF